MNVELMPYRLNCNFNEIADPVSYVDSYNGADLYKVDHPGHILPDIPVTDAHLYFIDEKLITIYLHLENNLNHLETLVTSLALQLSIKGILSRSKFGLKYRWEMDDQVLALVKDQIHQKFYLYHSIQQYAVL